METISSFINTNSQEQAEKLISEQYKEICKEVLKFSDVNDWVIKKSVSKSIMSAKNNPEARPHEIDPWTAIEEALNNDIIDSIQEGDKIWIYRSVFGEKQKKVKGELQYYKDGRPKMEKHAGYRFPQLWKNDQDTVHYLNRAHATLKSIKELITLENYPNYSQAREKKKLQELYEQCS